MNGTRVAPYKKLFSSHVAFGAFAGFAVGIAAASLWFFHVYVPSHPALSESWHPIELGREGLVNPLLAYAVPKDSSQLQSLYDKLKSQTDAEQRNGLAREVGIYFRDLDSGHWTGVNEATTFSPASLLKVPLMMAYFKHAESDPAFLAKEVLYDGSFDDNAQEDLKPLKSIQSGQSYSTEKLIEFMIQYSDNNATHLLFDHIDQNEFKQVFTDLKVPFPQSQDDFVGPRSFSLFFRVLYSATYLDKVFSEKALELLSYADFPQGIRAGVPEQVTVADKFGEHDFSDSAKELHDCGIVYQSAHPYFLCVMTKGSDFAKLANVIRDVSGVVYGEVDKNYGR